MVARASLHNADEIERLDVRAGDMVVVQRAGDVIPQILGFVPEERPRKTEKFHFPTHCPCPLATPVKAEEGGVVRRCSGGLECPFQQVERLRYFVSRNCFDIDGLGGTHIENFFNDGLLKIPGDIFRLPQRVDEIRKREGWGDLSVRNLVAAIEARRTIALDRFINALGIPLIGEATAKILAQEYGDADSWLAEMLAAAKERKHEARRREEGEGRRRDRPELRPAVQCRADRRHDRRRDVRLLQRRAQCRDHRGPAQAAHRRGA